MLATYITFEPKKYDNGEPWESWFTGLAWSVHALVILPIPVWFFLHLRRVVKTQGYTDMKDVRLMHVYYTR